MPMTITLESLSDLERLEHVVESFFDGSGHDKTVHESRFDLPNAMNATDSLVLGSQVHNRFHQNDVIGLDQVQSGCSTWKELQVRKRNRGAILHDLISETYVTYVLRPISNTVQE